MTNDRPSPTAFPSALPTETAIPTRTATGTPSHTPHPTSTLRPTATQTPSPAPIVYVVQAGDSLNRIARRFGTTAQAIAVANGIAPTQTLRIGQQLVIPPAGDRTVIPLAATEPATPPPTQAGTATSTALPTVVPTTTPPKPSPTTQPVPTPVGTVRARNTSVSLSVYPYEAAFVPSEPGDNIYPYPHLNFDRIGVPAQHTFQAILLENAYTAITIVPALGGRIYRWVDKTTNRDLLYRNPVLKPTHWGYRGWWLAAGGIEWAFPVDEHGLNEYRPWQVQTASTGDQVTILVSDTEDHTGLTVSVAILLDATHSYFTIQPRIYNPTGRAQPYQFWANAMVALANNRNNPSLRFILPADRVKVHSTNDSNLPPPKTTLSWPVYDGRDLSLYGNWQGYLGLFASPQATQGFVGLYDTRVDQGLVRIFPPNRATGAKFFGPGPLDSSLWTDDDSNYVEMWGGVTPTFWDYSTLNPGESLTWKEHWYPVSGIGGYLFANEQLAVNARKGDGTVQVSVAASGPFAGQAVLKQGNRGIASWPLRLMPGHPYRVDWPVPAGTAGPLSLQILDQAGQQIGAMSIPPT